MLQINPYLKLSPACLEKLEKDNLIALNTNKNVITFVSSQMMKTTDRAGEQKIQQLVEHGNKILQQLKLIQSALNAIQRTNS